jgi:hypothetical protein
MFVIKKRFIDPSLFSHNLPCQNASSIVISSNMLASSVASANNLAVSNMMKGAHDQAVKWLVLALKDLNAAFGGTGSQKKRVETETHPFLAQPQQYGSTQLDSECYAKWDGMFEFNDMLFLLPTELEYLAGNDTLLAMVVLYNLGSLMHKMGLSNGSSAELARALKFYELASEFLDNVPMSVSTEWKSIVFRVQCCLCNNMGHVCEQMCDFNECRCFLEWLLDVMEKQESTANADMEHKGFDTYFAFYAVPKERWFHPAPAA